MISLIKTPKSMAKADFTHFVILVSSNTKKTGPIMTLNKNPMPNA